MAVVWSSDLVDAGLSTVLAADPHKLHRRLVPSRVVALEVRVCRGRG